MFARTWRWLAKKWSYSLRERFRSRAFVLTVVLFALVFAVLARGYARQFHLPFRAVSGIYFCFVALAALVLLPGFYKAGEGTGRTRVAFLLIPLCVVPYLLYAAGTGDFRWPALLTLVSVTTASLVIYGFIPVAHPARFCWQDAALAILLITVVLSARLRGIWSVPVNLDFMGRLFLIALAAMNWVFLRPVPQLGYDFLLSRKILGQAAINFLLFATVAIPLSLALHFTRWNPRWPGVTAFAIDYLEIFLFIALLEELFFRGFLQTLLARSLQSRLAGQLAVSALFGLFHVLHAPFPNWRYVLLATLAGWFYGSAFNNAGNLMAPALAHAAVDTVWRTFLSAR